MVFLYSFVYTQNCNRYIPCESRTLEYTSMFILNNKVMTETERVQYTVSNNGTVNFAKTVVPVFGGGVLLNVSGIITVDDSHVYFPMDFFLPIPLNPLNIIDPPNIAKEGDGFSFPHNLSSGTIPSSSVMSVDVWRSQKQARKPNQAGSSDSSAGYRKEVQTTHRSVISLNESLTLNGTQMDCAVVKEKVNISGTFSTIRWEINWYTRGIGLVKSAYFDEDPGGNWNAMGNRGHKTLIAF